MTMPSSRELLPAPCPDCPRGIYAVRFPPYGVYARFEGITSEGRLLCTYDARSEDEVPTIMAHITRALDDFDPLPRSRHRPLAIMRG